MAAKKHQKQCPQRVPTKTPHVPTTPVELHPVVLSEYEITDEAQRRLIRVLPDMIYLDIPCVFQFPSLRMSDDVSDKEWHYV